MTWVSWRILLNCYHVAHFSLERIYAPYNYVKCKIEHIKIFLGDLDVDYLASSGTLKKIHGRGLIHSFGIYVFISKWEGGL